MKKKYERKVFIGYDAVIYSGGLHPGYLYVNEEGKTVQKADPSWSGMCNIFNAEGGNISFYTGDLQRVINVLQEMLDKHNEFVEEAKAEPLPKPKVLK